jgi:hypothetical protein
LSKRKVQKIRREVQATQKGVATKAFEFHVFLSFLITDSEKAKGKTENKSKKYYVKFPSSQQQP